MPKLDKMKRFTQLNKIQRILISQAKLFNRVNVIHEKILDKTKSELSAKIR